MLSNHIKCQKWSLCDKVKFGVVDTATMHGSHGLCFPDDVLVDAECLRKDVPVQWGRQERWAKIKLKWTLWHPCLPSDVICCCFWRFKSAKTSFQKWTSKRYAQIHRTLSVVPHRGKNWCLKSPQKSFQSCSFWLRNTLFLEWNKNLWFWTNNGPFPFNCFRSQMCRISLDSPPQKSFWFPIGTGQKQKV